MQTKTTTKSKTSRQLMPNMAALNCISASGGSRIAILDCLARVAWRSSPLSLAKDPTSLRSLLKKSLKKSSKMRSSKKKKMSRKRKKRL